MKILEFVLKNEIWMIFTVGMHIEKICAVENRIFKMVFGTYLLWIY